MPQLIHGLIQTGMASIKIFDAGIDYPRLRLLQEAMQLTNIRGRVRIQCSIACAMAHLLTPAGCHRRSPGSPR
jgi:hypothetical protein